MTTGATTAPSQIVQKLWNYCNVLRDDGMSYGDYFARLFSTNIGVSSYVSSYLAEK